MFKGASNRFHQSKSVDIGQLFSDRQATLTQLAKVKPETKSKAEKMLEMMRQILPGHTAETLIAEISSGNRAHQQQLNASRVAGLARGSSCALPNKGWTLAELRNGAPTRPCHACMLALYPDSPLCLRAQCRGFDALLHAANHFAVPGVS